jgi:uracil-DNA glycosylase
MPIYGISQFNEIMHTVRQCCHCLGELPHHPYPLLRGLPSAKILIISQAPGLKVHQTGLSFNDPSGDRLRSWINISRDQFYDESKIAIIPMGLCFPGRNKHGYDLPPVKKCAPIWHPKLLPLFPNIHITLLVGGYAQKFYLKDRCKVSLTETVRAFDEYLPDYFPLPHPSWRNTGWLMRHPWFESQVLPRLRSVIHQFIES